MHRLDAAALPPVQADPDPPAVFLSAFGTPLPEAWRARMKADIGIEPPDDRDPPCKTSPPSIH